MSRTPKASAKRGGAPRKAPGGLDKVLFVRANEELLQKLEELRKVRSAESPGVVLSKADLARMILWEAIKREEDEDGP